MNDEIPNAPAPGWFESLNKWTHRAQRELQLAVKTLLERDVKLDFKPSRIYQAREFEELFPDSPLIVTVRFTGAEVGDWNFAFPRKVAAMLSDLAMMGKGDVPFDESIHPGALGEIWGQVIASLEPQLNSLSGTQITVEMPIVSLDPAPFLTGLNSKPVVRWDFDIQDVGAGFVLHAFNPAIAGLLQKTVKESETPMPKKTTKIEAAPSEPQSPTVAPLVQSATFEDFASATAEAAPSEPRNIDMLLDITLPIVIELGRTSMQIRDVLELGPGSVIELDKLSGEPVDLYVNDKKFARGEVVVIEENFGVRITELVKLDDRLKGLQ